MNPDDQRAFSEADGNAVVSAVVLRAGRDGIHLRIHTNGADADEPVTNIPSSARNHRILFGDLRRVLMANGFCESGDEDAEAQATKSAED
ncbi:MAG TPA: hypothetical protein VFA99_01815 [Acidobacteriaceae bacterium]|nr:hypothetical protein [Acidobacteriaceae bacterium]